MPFDLNPAPTFEATAHITQPGGGHRSLKLVFHHKTKTQLKAFIADDSQSDGDMAAEIVAAVPGLPDGMAPPEFFAQLFENFPAAPIDIYFAYLRELREARKKN